MKQEDSIASSPKSDQESCSSHYTPSPPITSHPEANHPNYHMHLTPRMDSIDFGRMEELDPSSVIQDDGIDNTELDQYLPPGGAPVHYNYPPQYLKYYDEPNNNNKRRGDEYDEHNSRYHELQPSSALVKTERNIPYNIYQQTVQNSGHFTQSCQFPSTSVPLEGYTAFGNYFDPVDCGRKIF